jgi:4-aminobutyrate aminotransferase-like enzyme
MDDVTYLDGYNNVPHVGHCHPYVVEAVHRQAKQLNIHTRYLNDRVLDYAEQLLATVEEPLARLFLTNSGSEANELALRIARQHTGHTGILVTDFSYHGNTTSLAELTTGLPVHESLGTHVRAITIPDMDHESENEEAVLARSLIQVDTAIASLQQAGYGVSALLFDPLFSTEGLPRLPAGYVGAVVDRVRSAGGLIIADEVQSGFGRVGTSMWGHQLVEIVPDFVTLGKPMGNGHPMGGVLTTADLLDEFGSKNLYFNTFAGNPVSAAAGLAVLKVMKAEQLLDNAATTGRLLREKLAEFADRYDFVSAAKGQGLFTGLEFVDGATGKPAPAIAKRVVEGMLAREVLISRIGRHDNMLKIRPPMPFNREHVEILTERMADCLAHL